MISTEKCLHCGNSNIAGPHRLQGSSILLSRMRTATLNAHTCDNCGYTELFADQRGLNNIRKFGTYVDANITNKKTYGKYCSICGSSIVNAARFCTECGTSID
ncbi:MAG: hypothetical protein ACFE9L_13455 [Candidatus Hodarchaeota archaeon]